VLDQFASPLLLIFWRYRRDRLAGNLFGNSPTLELGAQSAPCQAATAVPRINRSLGEGGIIHQAQLSQAVEHESADLLANPALSQGISQLNPAAWPRGEQT
jgi:hypothetical protein